MSNQNPSNKDKLKQEPSPNSVMNIKVGGKDPSIGTPVLNPNFNHSPQSSKPPKGQNQ